MFGPDGVTVVDWQTIQQGAAASDVAYLLGASLTTADRRAHEDELLADYHAELCAAGVSDRPLEVLREDYRRCSAVRRRDDDRGVHAGQHGRSGPAHVRHHGRTPFHARTGCSSRTISALIVKNDVVDRLGPSTQTITPRV